MHGSGCPSEINLGFNIVIIYNYIYITTIHKRFLCEIAGDISKFVWDTEVGLVTIRQLELCVIYDF